MWTRTKGRINNSRQKPKEQCIRLEKYNLGGDLAYSCLEMRKTGNTEFTFDHLDIQTRGNVFMPMQALNELRRYGLEKLEEKIQEQYRRNAKTLY